MASPVAICFGLAPAVIQKPTEHQVLRLGADQRCDVAVEDGDDPQGDGRGAATGPCLGHAPLDGARTSTASSEIRTQARRRSMEKSLGSRVHRHEVASGCAGALVSCQRQGEQ